MKRNTLSKNIAETYTSLFDGVVEGLKVRNKPIFSVQYHPEASPGPHDTYGFFDSFYDAIMKTKKKMPKRNDIKSILIIGAGPIVIGQACEFDYSGSQACKILREEGYRIILINSNPATIMTDPDFADATYIEPITPEMVTKIIINEKPDAILPTMGGQTALNTAMNLAESGVLKNIM